MERYTRVEFQTADGTILRGNFFQAEGAKRPVVIMAEGLSLIKEAYAQLYAEAFQAAGISALIYDHRSYGSSDGYPRRETNPWQQAEDLHDAVTAAINLPGVDAHRVAIWGMGHGAAAAALAGTDPRLKAIILQALPAGSRDARHFPTGTLQRAWVDREEKIRTGDKTPTYVRLWPNSIENAHGQGEQVFLGGEGGFAFASGVALRFAASGTPWQDSITLQSFRHIANVEAQYYLTRIKCSLLYVALEDDPFTGSVEEHRERFRHAGAKAEFTLMPAFAASDFADWFKPSINVHLKYLLRVL